MTLSTPHTAFLRGARDGLPFLLMVVPFGLLFGVVGSEAGLRLAEVMGFSILVSAGASQFAALAQMQVDAPTIIVVATALTVNLRMAMYSAALTPYLGRAKLWQRALAAYLLIDQVYLVGSARFEAEPDLTLAGRLRYYFGVMVVIMPGWWGGTLAGALAGRAIPPEFALDFAVPIAFLAMVAPMLRTLAHVAAAVTSVVVALALAWMPYGTGLIVAALAAMGAGAATELWMERQKR